MSDAAEVTLTELELEGFKGRSAELGKECGHNAGTWFEVSGHREASRILRMLDDGDPRVEERLNEPAPLSGEHTDDMTPKSLFETLGTPGGLSDFDEADIMSAYEDAFHEAFIAEVERTCHAQLD
jgi:hypothetical protein